MPSYARGADVDVRYIIYAITTMPIRQRDRDMRHAFISMRYTPRHAFISSPCALLSPRYALRHAAATIAILLILHIIR